MFLFSVHCVVGRVCSCANTCSFDVLYKETLAKAETRLFYVYCLLNVCLDEEAKERTNGATFTLILSCVYFFATAVEDLIISIIGRPVNSFTDKTKLNTI